MTKIIDINTYPDAAEMQTILLDWLTPFHKGGYSYKLQISKQDYNGYAIIIDLYKDNQEYDRIYVADPYLDKAVAEAKRLLMVCAPTPLSFEAPL